jgi:hypothetical protein
MKRKITVKTKHVTITAILNTEGTRLARHEIEIVRDDLADALQDAVTQMRYLRIARNRVVVE